MSLRYQAGLQYQLTRLSFLEIFNGAYLESASSAVCAIFLGVGVGSLLWLRGFVGPGPMTFGVM